MHICSRFLERTAVLIIIDNYLFWSGSKNSRPILTGGQNLTKITRLIFLQAEIDRKNCPNSYSTIIEGVSSILGNKEVLLVIINRDVSLVVVCVGC